MVTNLGDYPRGEFRYCLGKYSADEIPRIFLLLNSKKLKTKNKFKKYKIILHAYKHKDMEKEVSIDYQMFRWLYINNNYNDQVI